MVLKKLLSPGVLGMNHRNIHLISKYNGRAAIKLVNDKHLLKGVFLKKKIPTTPSIARFTDLLSFERGLAKLPAPFVVKPSNGSAGKGIIIVKALGKGPGEEFFDVSGRKWTVETLGMHALNILNGEYSVGAVRDSVIVEELIEPSPFFQKLCEKGLPDIRIIVFLGKPIAGMVRLPNEISGWKANISRGALAAGLDIETGKITSIYSKKDKERISPPPKNYALKIPDWDEIISLSLKAAEASGLGYCGVDIVVSDKGPLVMECNARPGLEIQNVTGIDLLFEKEKVEAELAEAREKKPRYVDLLHRANRAVKSLVFKQNAGGRTRK